MEPSTAYLLMAYFTVIVLPVGALLGATLIANYFEEDSE